MVVEVAVEGTERPPAGVPLVVQLLDTTFADAPARVVHEATARVGAGGGSSLQTVELPRVPEGQANYRVRAHVDVDGNQAVSPGDFVTTVAYPARGDERVRVVVRKV
jgi:uncharacterized lipoprotein YbaY